jgi:hypothetical protein
VVLVHRGAEVVVGELAGPCAELAVVDALARLQLLARRLGCSIRVRHPSEELRDLLALVGLADVIAGCGSALQAGGEAERGEQLRVEEVVEPGDPPA